jgi:hypothetical protein
LKGHETDGFILVSAARASITQRYHLPVWKDAQLLLKRSFTSLLSGMQYFAPLSIGPQIVPTLDEDDPKNTQPQPKHRHFQWLTREIIEEKDPSIPNDKLNNYLRSGDAVGGVVTSEFLVLLSYKAIFFSYSSRSFFTNFSKLSFVFVLFESATIEKFSITKSGLTLFLSGLGFLI